MRDEPRQSLDDEQLRSRIVELAQERPSHILLHWVMRQGCLRTDDRILPAYAVNPGISQLWEADVGVTLEKMGRKTMVSAEQCISAVGTHDYWLKK